MLEYTFFNDQIIKSADTKISPMDLGLLRGFGVFDFLRTAGQTPLFLDLHLDRFENSAKLVGLKIPNSREKIKEIIFELIKKNQTDNVSIKLILTGGNSLDGLTISAHPTFFIILHKLTVHDSNYYIHGIKLLSYDYQRELPRAKTTNYLTKMSLSGQLQASNAQEILYKINGFILEGATSNFFLIKDNKLITARDNILLGTRRKLILELAKNDFQIEERPVKFEEIASADEAFISSTSRNILPVTQIDNLTIGQGTPGPKTQLLFNKLQQLIQQNN